MEMADSLAFTPAEDTPVVTYASVPAGSVSTIVGSAGWLREKRVGVAEGAAGAAQSSIADLDVLGSTRFRYPAVPGAPGVAANPGQYVQTGFKPGSTAVLQNAHWLFNIEFVTSSAEVEVRLRSPSVNPAFGMVLVNGRRVQEQAFRAVSAAGVGLGAKLAFPDARSRTITIRGVCAAEGDFGGVAVQAGHTAVKTTPTIARRIAFIGDSYSNGAGTYPDGTGPTETFIWRLAAKMGADDVLAAGIGGTGWIATLSGEPTSNFAGRIAPVMALAPHVVVWVGGRNDGAADPGALQAQIEADFDAVGAGVDRYVIRTSANGSGINAAIAAACASRGVTYLDVDIDALPKLVDAVHPTFLGHAALADAAYAKVLPPQASVRAGRGERNYYASVSGLAAPQERSLSDHKRAHLVSATGLPASSSLADLEEARYGSSEHAWWVAATGASPTLSLSDLKAIFFSPYA